MKTPFTTVGTAVGMGLGGLTMYLLDPEQGRRRRARLGDQTRRARHQASFGLHAIWADFSHRLSGARSRISTSSKEVPDSVLAARLRSRLGRIASHPRSIRVAVENGEVTLHGYILAREAPGLIARLRKVPGVQSITSRLNLCVSAAHIPQLQGSGRQRSHDHWPPSFRAGAVLGGLGLLGLGLRRGGFAGTLLGAAGTLLTVRAVSDRRLSRLARDAGMGVRGGLWRSCFTFEMRAPVAEVYGETLKAMQAAEPRLWILRRQPERKLVWRAEGVVAQAIFQRRGPERTLIRMRIAFVPAWARWSARLLGREALDQRLFDALRAVKGIVEAAASPPARQVLAIGQA